MIYLEYPLSPYPAYVK
ncbi:unnamed protein product, partial [Adineta steineri]